MSGSQLRKSDDEFVFCVPIVAPQLYRFGGFKWDMSPKTPGIFLAAWDS